MRVATWSLALLAAAMLAVPTGLGHGGLTDEAKAVADALIRDWNTRQTISNETTAQEAVLEDGSYPLPADAHLRFVDYEVREDLAPAGELEGAYRVLRIAHVTDMQLIDDDAPEPVRCGPADAFFGSLGLGFDGCSRPQEEYTDEILHSMMDILNAHHGLDPFDFAIHTGDNIDNALENELMRYIDIVDGSHTTVGPITGNNCVADGQSADLDDADNDVTDQCTSIPEHLVPEIRGFAADVPWYSAYGNHDGLIQGNVAPNIAFAEAAALFGRHFITEQEYVAMHFADLNACSGGTDEDHFGHGFGYAADRLCDDDVDNDAYYAFDAGGVRMIVLNTVHDEILESQAQVGPLISVEGTVGRDVASGLAPGGLDQEQLEWLEAELAAAAGPVIIYAHHTMESFWNDFFDENASPYPPPCSPDNQCLDDLIQAAGIVGRNTVDAVLAQYPNIVAFIGGHTHQHRVQTYVPGDTHPGFWNIESSGLLDLPQESRIIELWSTWDGAKAFLALDPIGHTFDLARDLGALDDQVDAAEATGTALDRRVLLWIELPDGANLTMGVQPPRYEPVEEMTLTLLEPQADSALRPGTHAVRVQALAAIDPAPIDFLNATMFVAPPGGGADGEAMVGMTAPIMMEGEGNGTYMAEYEFTKTGEYALSFLVEDPGVYFALATLQVTLEVKKDDKGSPAVPMVLVLGVLAAVAIARRRD